MQDSNSHVGSSWWPIGIREKSRDEPLSETHQCPGEGPPAEDHQPELTPRREQGPMCPRPMLLPSLAGLPLAEQPEPQDSESPGMRSILISEGGSREGRREGRGRMGEAAADLPAQQQ